MNTDKPIFNDPVLRVEPETYANQQPKKHFVRGWMMETILYGCMIDTLRRSSGRILCIGTKIESEERNKYGRVVGIMWDAPKILLAEEPAGARATKSRVAGCHLLGLARFLSVHKHLICSQEELDAIAAFDAAPAAPRDEYAEFWDCVVAPAEAQGQPQNINEEGEQ